jgi:hypothetical protein
MSNVAPFIDGSYGWTVLLLLALGLNGWMRYRRARRQLAAVDTRR